MLPEYLGYWGFARSPFSLSPDPGMLFLGSQHHEALLRLKYAVLSNKGGALLISDDAGNGKTSILRRLVDDLNVECQGRTKIAFLDHPTLTVNQMIAEIARQLGVARVRKEKIDNLNALRGKLLALHESGMKTVVIVDEGQMLVHKPDILQELRILLNFCVSEAFLLSFILSGQKPLEGAIRRMPEFWQRLPVRVFLRNVDARETAELVRYRVRAAGQTERELFTPTAVDGIYRFSQGCPRVICAAADLALLIGHSRRSRSVDFVEVSEAVSDMSRGGEVFHYFSFGGASQPKLDNGGRCTACGRFVKSSDTACGRCGAVLGRAPAPAPVTRDGEREAHDPVPGRDRVASRRFEEGLRRIGVGPIPATVSRRFPVLQDEGRVYMGCVAPRFFWGRRSQLHTADKVLEGSFFVTERSLVFANGSDARRIRYPEIRNLSINMDDGRSGVALPRMRILLQDEELRLAFAVRTDRPLQLVSLLSEFVTNKRLPVATV